MNGEGGQVRLVVAAIACAAVAVIVPIEVVRILAAIPLALFLPGYALTAAIFEPRVLSIAWRLTLALALSIACLALGTLILNYVPGGIRESSWAILLCVVVAVAAVCGRIRWGARQGSPRPRPRLRFRGADLAMLGVGLAALIVAIGVAWTPVGATNAVGYTQFWALSGGGSDVRIGIRSQEHDQTEYRLVLVDRGTRKVLDSRVDLDPGDTYLFDLSVFPPATDRDPRRISALLFLRDRREEPYRRVTTWIPGRPQFR